MAQLALLPALEHITEQELGPEVLQPQLFAGLAAQGLVHRFPPVHVAAHGRVPTARLDVLPERTALQVEPAVRRKNVEMDHGVKQHGAAVTLAARGPPHGLALRIHHGEPFPGIVLRHRLIV